MTRHATMLGMLLVSIVEVGCAASRLKPVTIPPGRISASSGSGSVDVSARALQPGPRQIKAMNQEIEIDEQQCAQMLQEAISQELTREGFTVAKDAPNKVDITVLHLSVMGGMTFRCFVDFVVVEQGGAERGFQSYGSGDLYGACETALENAAVTVLNDPAIRASIAKPSPSLAEGKPTN